MILKKISRLYLWDIVGFKKQMEKKTMNTFKIKYYYQSTFRNGRANDWDNIESETVQLNLPSDATRGEVCKLWQDENTKKFGYGYRRVTFVSSELINL